MYPVGLEWPLGFVWPGEAKDVAVEENTRGSYDSAPKWPAQGTATSKDSR